MGLLGLIVSACLLLAAAGRASARPGEIAESTARRSPGREEMAEQNRIEAAVVECEASTPMMCAFAREQSLLAW